MLKIKNKKGELVAELGDEDTEPKFIKDKKDKDKDGDDDEGRENKEEEV